MVASARSPARMERRQQSRRNSDKVLGKILEVLRVVERLSKGEDVDFTEAYADLVGLKDQLGRRREDRELGEALCVTLGSIASNIVSLTARGADYTRKRKVRLRRCGGGLQILDTIIEGWEQQPPVVGKSYVVLQENGRFIRTSSITKITGKFLHTRNSVYELEILEQNHGPKVRIPPKEHNLE